MGVCDSKVLDTGHPTTAKKISAKTNQKEEILEKFIATVYTDGNKFEAVRMILQDVWSRNYFRKFLKSEFAAEGLLFYEEAELFKKADPENLAAAAKSLCANYLNPGCDNEVNVSDAMKSSLIALLSAEPLNRSEVLVTLDACQREVIAILAMNGFPRYINSPDYIIWRRDERMFASKYEIATAKPNAAQPHVADRAFGSIEPSELSLLCEKGSWMKNFIALAEILPVSVTISVGRADRRGFPMMYVNPEFSRMTGYARHECIGKNCKFLQSDKSERDSLHQIITALTTNAIAKVDITNFRKDGQFFRNLITFRPVLNNADELQYVIALQQDITGEGMSNKVIKFADAIIDGIPGSL